MQDTSNLDLWLKGCESMGLHVYRLDDKGSLKLFYTWADTHYDSKASRDGYARKDTYYHVWYHDQWRSFYSDNMLNAMRLYSYLSENREITLREFKSLDPERFKYDSEMWRGIYDEAVPG